jgi:multisubunit Na+/H+ antiporter MnhE subunit
MFRNLSIKSIIIIFMSLLLCVALLQVYLFLTNRSMLVHFSLSFIALFIALLLFRSVNIKLKRRKKR